MKAREYVLCVHFLTHGDQVCLQSRYGVVHRELYLHDVRGGHDDCDLRYD